MADTNIPISDRTLARLRELARWTGASLDQALDQAVQAHYDRTFWEATNAAYARLRADPAAWAEVEDERRSMEGTLLDGLPADERWAEDGRAAPPTAPGSGQ